MNLWSRELAERFRSFVYETAADAKLIIRALSMVNALLAIILLVIAYGFYLSDIEKELVFDFFDIVFALFVILYIAKLIYADNWWRFAWRHWYETILVLFLLVNVLLNLLLNKRLLAELALFLEWESPRAFYELILSFYLLLWLFLEIGRSGHFISRLNVKPSTLFLLSFLLLIAVGTGLLMLPTFTKGPDSMPFLDALFTATSAACVTGLIVVDTATYFTLKGQVVILVLIQFGGIGIVTFATFFALFAQERVGIRHQSLLRDILSTENLKSSVVLLRQIFTFTFLFEGLGALFIFWAWGSSVPFESLWQKIFYSVFHSVSAFCNAGFSLFSNGLYEEGVRSAYVLHLVIAFIIILGGIGFGTWNDFSIKRLRERLEKPWKDWRISTKIVVYTTLFLLLIGTVVFYALERHALLRDMNTMEALIASFFQSVTTRTAGFNTVDLSQMRVPTVLMFIGLMFIGASPASTGGGIKTTTITVLFFAMIDSIRGKKDLELGHRRIAPEVISKAYTVFIVAVVYNFLAIFFLTITEPELPVLSLIFEQVSAFATVGLSLGITPELSAAGKCIIILSMYLGRVGTLTLALALSTKVISTNYGYPTEYVMVG
ncbi:MAG: hypothetical protein KatS3mg033_1673 [Thermonema sp.]|uniref:TrkH family potassium uptake protein n=1 Tax=Thermonema sp. TaxID=2231181 RepID=UPI0021DC1D7F|nr:TrkH family potassium uptake protein [Thermonema sp.]GIV39873.1 MAG: hypothetical protein KatS3mg033_1673 [Thermonema sp.]